MSGLRLLADTDGDEVLRELLFDQLAKIGIVVVGLCVLGAGMVFVWRHVARRGDRD